MSVNNSINVDLLKERQNASFDSEEFAALFWQGENKLQMKRFFETELLSDTEDLHIYEYLSYEDLYTKALNDCVKAAEKLKKLQNKINPDGNEIYPTLMMGPLAESLMPLGNTFTVHILMFTRALKSHGTDELYQKFGKRADNFEIIGTYAQTELGHGTNLKGLETRADYDRKTDEFILNTPTLSSYKWWPGGLGQSVNYCIVVAQLYINNESKGIQMFLLQVRDEETHMPLPGIDIGDIGKKIGFNGVNNGFLGLKNVRIPRTNMLMRNSKVLSDGTFIQSPKSQLAYLPMVYVRCMVVFNAGYHLALAATIATRYSAVRRQSPINPDEPEPQILDHVTQQHKLFPEIATAIAYNLSASKLNQYFQDTTVAIKKNDFSRLEELHALACTLKASSSYDATAGIERLRLACGGHGYLTSSNFGNIYAKISVTCTYEGENTVLYLQVGKILMKKWADVLAEKQLMPTMSYLNDWKNSKTFNWNGSWDCMIKALQFVTTKKTEITFSHYMRRLKMGQSQPIALNNTGIELIQVAELHACVFVASNFFTEVTGDALAKQSNELRAVLHNLLELFLLKTILRYMNFILLFINLTDADVTDLQNRLEEVLKRLRPDAVAICDSFDFHDSVLQSTLGAYDGNVYERIYAAAKQSSLNSQPVPKSFHTHLKPFMQGKL
ncbi:probable peroxisomal acyl-coenzyme A oxidase 1 [Teleopsis dalmanni]|uniref:probable peroxisomal acyl-coenzyme A oxidase 1 n=1 Tax=Teleopsis dalmanni TaxID=139649 RepID=UPI0018CEA558|nr:probable peroxisomal acyl-coenzyme A oxidase 1 [Teleopsis dalmanni]